MQHADSDDAHGGMKHPISLTIMLAVGTVASSCSSAHAEPVSSPPSAPFLASSVDPLQDDGARPWHEVFHDSEARVREFCETIPRQGHQRVSIAVMPLLYQDARTSARSDWAVTEAGGDVADHVVSALESTMPEADVFSPREIMYRYAEQNLSSVAFTDPAAVRTYGHQLGFDVVVFGRMRLVRFRSTTRYDIECELIAVDVVNGMDIGSPARWSIPNNDSRNRPIYDALAYVDRNWVVEDRVDLNFEGQSLDEAMENVERVLGSRLRQVIDEKTPSGTGEAGAPSGDTGTTEASSNNGDSERGEGEDESGVKPPPVEYSGPPRPGIGDRNVFVAPGYAPQSVTTLHEIQSLSHELTRLRFSIERSASEAEELPDWTAPVDIAGRSFESFMAAKEYLAEQRREHASTSVSKVCDDLSSGVREYIVPLTHHDLLPPQTLEVALVDGVAVAMRSGTFDGERSIVQQLRDEGVDIVVINYFENQGTHFAVRGRIIDLAEPGVVREVYVTIDRRYYEELTERLES